MGHKQGFELAVYLYYYNIYLQKRQNCDYIVMFNGTFDTPRNWLKNKVLNNLIYILLIPIQRVDTRALRFKYEIFSANI